MANNNNSVEYIETTSGLVRVYYPTLDQIPVSDKTLKEDGKFADAAVVGQHFDETKKNITELQKNYSAIEEINIDKDENNDLVVGGNIIISSAIPEKTILAVVDKYTTKKIPTSCEYSNGYLLFRNNQNVECFNVHIGTGNTGSATPELSEISSQINNLQSQINLLNNKVNDYHSGASIENYNITVSLSNCSINNNTTTIKKGNSYSAIITPNTGYTLSSVNCVMNGVAQTVNDGVINISSVIGDINITATAISSIEPSKTYKISNNLTNCKSSNTATTITEGKSYNTTITANMGYKLSSVTCTMGGTNIPVNDGVINISSATGDIVIIATATEEQTEPVETYNVALYLTKCTSSNTATATPKGKPYTTTITADTGYKISNVVCRMGGIQQQVGAGDRSRTITIASVTGDISITAVTVRDESTPTVETYTITNNLTNCNNSNAATTVEKGKSYSATITASAGHKLDSVTCTMGGVAQTVTNGQINIASVTGNIVITASATSTSTGETSYNVTYNLQGCTSSNTATTVAKGSSYAATITAQTGYTLNSVTCTMGGTTQTVTNGRISISSVTGDIIITATAIKNAVVDGEHAITYNLLNCDASQTVESVKSGSPYSTTITPKSGYDLYVVTYTLGANTNDIHQLKKGSDTANSVNINISSLTDDLIITALAVSSANKGDAVLTATQINDDITAGWNLGNTFDASSGTVLASAKNRTSSEGTDYETMWGQPVTTKDMIKAVYDKGFNAIRIPITWNHHIVDKDRTGNNIAIAPSFLNRVKAVVDYAYNLGMYVIINTHHDASDYSNGKTMSQCNPPADYVTWKTDTPFQLWNAESQTASNAEMCKNITRMWTLLANLFKDYNHHLIFEGYNEILGKVRGVSGWGIPSETRQTYARNLNQAFINAVRATGGKNTTRVLSVESYGAMLDSASVASVKNLTDSATDALLLQAHLYVTSGTAIIDQSKHIRALGKPVILGEMGWKDGDQTVHDDNMHDFAQNYIANAKKVGIKSFWWDENTFVDYGNKPSFGLLNRSTLTWDRPRTAQGVIDGASGNTVEPKYKSEYNATAENIDTDFKNGTYYAVANKTIDAIEEVGNLNSSYTGNGLLCTTLKISGNDNVMVQVHNIECDEVGNTDVFKIKRCICIDKNHQVILDYQNLYQSDAVQGMNEATIVPPEGTVYMRLAFAQIYNNYITSDSVRSAIKAGKASIRIMSDNEISIDHTEFKALVDNIKLNSAKYVLANELKAGYIITQHDIDHDKLTGFAVGDVKPALDYPGLTNKINQYGSITSLFKDCKQGDTITIHPVTPGYGNSYHVYCTTRYAWYDSNDKVVSATRLPSATSDPVTLTCPTGASRLRVTCANPYDVGTIAGNGGTDIFIINGGSYQITQNGVQKTVTQPGYIKNGWIRIEYTASSSAIIKGTSSEVSHN